MKVHKFYWCALCSNQTESHSDHKLSLPLLFWILCYSNGLKMTTNRSKHFYWTWHWTLRTSNSRRIVLRLADRQPEDASTVRYHREVRLCESFIHPETQEERYLWADCKSVSVQQAHIYSNIIIILFYFRYLAVYFHVSCFFKWLIYDFFKSLSWSFLGLYGFTSAAMWFVLLT